MKKSAKENIGKVAIIENSPHLKKALAKYGHKVGDTFLSSKEIASVAVLSSLSEKGLSFDFVVDKLMESFEAMSSVVVKVDKDMEQVEEVIDYKTRLTAIQTYLDLIGIRKGITVPEVSVDLMKTEPISISFKSGKKPKKEEEIEIEEVPKI